MQSPRRLGLSWARLPALGRILALLLTAAALLTQTAPASAQGGDRQAALKLAGEAIDLYAAGDFEAALEKFSKADLLVNVPTLKLRIARCLDKLNRMQEAAAKYREVISYELPKNAPTPHREARKEAVPELAALREQIPNVTVVVDGESAAEASVTLAGEPWPSELLGQKQEMDPGSYAFEATHGDRTVRKLLNLERGQSERVELLLPTVKAETEGAAADGDSGNTMRTLGYSSLFGLGGAGLAMAVIAGVVVLQEEDALLERCENRQCQPEAHDDAKAFDAARHTTTAGIVIGAVGIAAGVTLLLLAPSDTSSEGATTARIQPYFGPTGAGLQGSF